jgi:glucokinase
MEKRLALGIDIGGTNTSFGVVDETGKILLKGAMPTTGHDTIEDYIAALKGNLAHLSGQVGREHIAGAGIGAPNGNHFTGEIVFAPNLPWKGILPLAKLVSEALGMKASLTNDAKAAAIGEMAYGAARGMKDFILVTLGTGLGSGFVSNGKIIYGHDGMAGELGHAIAVKEGRKCNCGRYGCLERYASATGVAITAELWLRERKEDSALRGHAGKISSRIVAGAAAKGDAMAIDIFEYTGKILGQALADAVTVTSPQAIIFFGGLAQAGKILLGPVRRHLEESLLPVYKNKISLIHSALPGADAAILGASALVWQAPGE